MIVLRFLKCGKTSIFYDTFHWLIITNKSKDIFSYLNNTNLNINADVNVATVNPNDSKEYKIFDVYNPAFKHGGKLQIKQLNVYSKSIGIYTSPTTQSKYWSRKNMSEVTFKSAIVVNYASIVC